MHRLVADFCSSVPTLTPTSTAAPTHLGRRLLFCDIEARSPNTSPTGSLPLHDSLLKCQTDVPYPQTHSLRAAHGLSPFRRSFVAPCGSRRLHLPRLLTISRLRIAPITDIHVHWRRGVLAQLRCRQVSQAYGQQVVRHLGTNRYRPIISMKLRIPSLIVATNPKCDCLFVLPLHGRMPTRPLHMDMSWHKRRV